MDTVNKYYYVYVWKKPDTNEVFYVGKGHGNRYKDLRSRNQNCLQIAEYYGIDSIKKEILESNLSEQEAFEKEQYYIKLYEDSQPLTNKNKGGLGSGDWFERATPEEQERHREISKSFLGKKHSEETKQKMSQSYKGKKHNMTEEGRRRLSEAVKNRARCRKNTSLNIQNNNDLLTPQSTIETVSSD